MSYVVAIDVGIKNLAVCAYDFVTCKIVHWDNVTLVPNGRYIPALNVQYVRDFVFKHSHLFEKAAIVLVERQMRCNMRIIESVIQSMFFDRCVVVNARCVKAHYGLGTRNYRANKAKAVEWAREFVTSNPAQFVDPLATRFLQSQKQDDLADALLMTTYYLDTYSNIPTEWDHA
tara:strand:- start:920 stop:1441 length:522 start_codon:yes stop_codon:yes gene_type:complete